MQKSQQQVKEFHNKFSLVINDKPTIPDKATLKLRCKLLLEEVLEFIEAAGFYVDSEFAIHLNDRTSANLILMVDALADIQYVNDGAAISLGVDLEPIGNEVHRSNMSKVWNKDDVKNRSNPYWIIKGNDIDGYLVKDENGKLIKPPSYSPADIQLELFKQGANFETV